MADTLNELDQAELEILKKYFWTPEELEGTAFIGDSPCQTLKNIAETLHVVEDALNELGVAPGAVRIVIEVYSAAVAHAKHLEGLHHELAELRQGRAQ